MENPLHCYELVSRIRLDREQPHRNTRNIFSSNSNGVINIEINNRKNGTLSKQHLNGVIKDLEYILKELKDEKQQQEFQGQSRASKHPDPKRNK